jgi:glyoxylase-like metal-dependent hydrolase (beta-lactamase superfamily II)
MDASVNHQSECSTVVSKLSMATLQRAEPLRIGSITLVPVSDGAILQMPPASIFQDAAPQEWQPRVTLNEHGNLELALTCLLVQVGERRILVDTGYGPVPDRPEVGLLPSALAEVGVATGAIDTVILSHPHGDHVGGTVLGSGESVSPAYASARYWLGKADWEHYSQPNVTGHLTLEEKIAPLERAQRLDLADGEQEIAPGVRLLPLPGHTPGHMGVAFTSGQQTAIYVGDLVHHPLQIEHPEWSPVFDALPPLSRETRRALVERARRERSLVLSYHLPFPGIGRVGARGWDAVSI